MGWTAGAALLTSLSIRGLAAVAVHVLAVARLGRLAHSGGSLHVSSGADRLWTSLRGLQHARRGVRALISLLRAAAEVCSASARSRTLPTSGLCVALRCSGCPSLTLVQQPVGYSADTAGFLGATLLLAGLFAAAVSAPLFDRVLTSHLAITIKVLCPILGAAWLSLIWAGTSRFATRLASVLRC
jgi:hypothetical protein